VVEVLAPDALALTDELVADPEEEPTVFETLEDAVAAMGEVAVVGPDSTDDDEAFGETDEPE
jgi:hypothetical protein